MNNITQSLSGNGQDDNKITKISNQLKILSDQFSATLTQYQQTYDNYHSLLQSNAMTKSAMSIDASANSTVNGTIGATVTGKAELYATIPNATYWGQTGLSEGSSHSPSECLADCYTKPACTGATYDSDTNYCWIRTGDGRIAPGKQNQTAIIKKTMLYEYQLKDLNNKLQNINNQIIVLIDTNSQLFEQNDQLRIQKQDMLEHNRRILQSKEEQMKILHRDNITLQSAEQNSSLLVNQNYFWYILSLFVVIFLGIFLVKILLLPESSSSSSSSSEYSILGGSRNGSRNGSRK